MSKRIFVVLLALAAMSATSAYASRATNLVMGSGDAGAVLGGAAGGSLFYDDARNIFYNPAYINDFRNWATIEKSNANAAAGTGTRAEGGFATSIMNFNVGIFLDRGGYALSPSGLANIAGVPGAFVMGTATATGYTAVPVRPVELFVGSDIGMMKWGAELSHASVSNAAGTSSNIQLAVGAEIMGLDPFFETTVQGKDAGSATVPSGTHNAWRLGTRYHWGEWTPYAAVGSSHDNIGAGLRETAWGLGLGRSAKVAEAVRLNYALSYWRVMDTAAAAPNSTKRQLLPVDVSLEGDANGWLTLRAGMQYRLMDKLESNSMPDMTTGRIGATIHVQKVDFDWAVGTNGGAGPEGATDLDQQTFSIGGGFFAAASLTYHW